MCYSFSAENIGGVNVDRSQLCVSEQGLPEVRRVLLLNKLDWIFPDGPCENVVIQTQFMVASADFEIYLSLTMHDKGLLLKE